MRKIKIIIILLIMSVLFSSCTNYENYNNTAGSEDTAARNSAAEDEIMDKGPEKGGLLNLFSTRPDTLNPLLTNNVFVRDFTNLIFEGLVKIDKDQKPVPVLADRWDISNDGLIWTFHIRNNVLWHDNIPLSADDIKFTIETIQNSSLKSIYKKNIQNIAVFTVVNRNTFRIFLKRPDSFTLESMTFPIIPKHYYAGAGITQLNSKKNMAPVGTGPYKYVAGANSKIISLTANEKWWNSENKEKAELPFPYIQDINIKIYPKETDAVSAFQTADIDVAPVQTGDFTKYNGRSDLLIRKYTGRNYEFLGFNLENPALGEKAVRQAIALGIDKSKIINEILPGEAIVADIPLMPNTWLYNTGILAYSPDKIKAKELLLKDGWKENKGVMYKNIKGVRRTLKFEMLVNNYNETRDKVAKNISGQLKEIGIEIVIKKVNWDDEFKLINKKKFDMVLLGYKISSIPDVSFAYSSADIATGLNVSGYKNPTVDLLLDQIKGQNDPNTKKALFYNLRNVITDEVPYIGLFFYNNALLYNKRIRGDISPYDWDKYYNITKWYIPEGK